MLVLNNMVNDSRVIKEAQSLSSAGHTVTVLAIEDGDARAGLGKMAGFTIRRVSIVTRRYLRGWIFAPLKFAEYFLRTLFIAFSEKADVYHSHEISPFAIAWLAARYNGAKLIYDSHELEYDRNSPKFTRWILRLYERLFANRADKIIVSDGKFRATVMRKKNGVRRPMTFIMNCPRRVTIEQINRARLREMLNLSADWKIVLYIGSLFLDRGIRELLEAASLLDNVNVVIMGTQHAIQKELEEWLERYGMRNRTHLIGPFPPDEVAVVASGADIGAVLVQNVCLSFYYSTPTKMFESIAARIPVLVSNFPAMREIVEKNNVGPVGLAVDETSPTAIAEAIKSLISDEYRMEALRQNCGMLHETEYNWEKQEKKLLALYTELYE